jgi:hypothetical protein
MHRSQGTSVEGVLEGVLFDVESGVRYVITEKTVGSGEVIKRSLSQSKAPLTARLMRWSASGQT